MLDRYPSRPYISEGHPMNQTAIVSGNVTFKCPVVSDIAAHITWAKYLALNDNDTDSDFPSQPNTIRFQVYSSELNSFYFTLYFWLLVNFHGIFW